MLNLILKNKINQTIFIFILLSIIAITYQNCAEQVSVKFYSPRGSFLSTIVTSGSRGPYDGKPADGYYCRIYDNLDCQPQVQNLQSLVKVENSKIDLIQDNCSSKSVSFFAGEAGTEFSSLASDYIGLSRGIFKKCDVGPNNLPEPSEIMTDAYCVSHKDNFVVVLNKSLANRDYSFRLFFNDKLQSRSIQGNSITRTLNLGKVVYRSSIEQFDLTINQNNSQAFPGQLQVSLDNKTLTVDLECRTANPEPTVIIEKDLEISPTWIDTARLAGYWKFNETNAANGSLITDSTSYAAHGILNTDNGGLIKSDPSVIGGSLFFDGTNDSVRVLNPQDGHLRFSIGSFTYMAWIRKTGHAGSFDMPIWHGGSSANTAGYDIECGRTCYASISDGGTLSTSTRQALFASDMNPYIGRWVLLTAVVDRNLNQLRAYFDGALISTTDISTVGSVSEENHDLFLGGALLGNIPDYFFMGSIDDVSIWNQALSEKEITEIFQRLRPKFY